MISRTRHRHTPWRDAASFKRPRLRKELDELLERGRPEIRRLLADYGVLLVEE